MSKSLVISLLILISFIHAKAQTAEIDSLKGLISFKKDTAKVDLLNRICFLTRKHNLDSAKIYLARSKVLANSIDYNSGIARIMNLEAMDLIHKKKYLESIEANKKALETAKSGHNDIVLSQIYTGIGFSYYKLMDYNKSLEAFFMSLNHARNTDDKEKLTFALTNIIAIHIAQKNYDLAERYLNEIKELGEELNNDRTLASAYGKFGDIYFFRKEFDKSLKYNELRLKHAKKAEVSSTITYAKYKIIFLHIENNNLGKAIDLLNNLEEPDKNTKRERTSYTYSWSKIHFKKGNYNEAIKLAKIVLKDAKPNNSNQELIGLTYKLIEDSEIAKGNYKNAYNVSNEFQQWSNDHELEKQEQRAINIESIYQFEKKEIENKLLKEEQSKNKAILKQQSIFSFAALFSSVLLSLLLFLLYKGYRDKLAYNKKLEKEVESRTESLVNSNKRLLQSNTELERFAYIASHDLKEPLRNINSFTQLIEKRYSSLIDNEFDDFLGHIRQNVDQMKGLIEGILEYSRISDLQQNVEVDLNLILEDVKLFLMHEINHNGATIYNNELPVFSGNKAQLFQVFKNLIHNGLKFNKNKEPVVNITYQEGANRHYIAFLDNGIGIQQEYRQRIFEMFTRLNNRAEYEGSGIGLAMVQKIIQLQNGSLQLVRSDETGSCFLFSLPKSGHSTKKRIHKQELIINNEQ